MSNKDSKKRRGFLDTIFELAERAIDGYNEIINQIQDRIFNLAGNMEKFLKGEETGKDEELKEYMKVSIKDIEQKEPESEINVKSIPNEEIAWPAEVKDKVDIKIPESAVVKVEDLIKKEEEKVEEVVLPAEEIVEEVVLPAEEKVKEVVLPAEEIVEEVFLPAEEEFEEVVLPAEEIVEEVVLPAEEIVEEIVLPAEEIVEEVDSPILEEDVKRLLVIYGVDRQKAIILIENDIKTVYKLASEVPSRISRLLGISVVEAQNVIRAANAMIF